LVTFIVVILLCSFLCSVSAKSTTGLSDGDKFMYWRYCIWESNDPRVTSVPDYFINENNTDITVKVNSVSSTIVNVDITSEYSDGTKDTRSFSPNIQTGENNDPPVSRYDNYPEILDNMKLIQTPQTSINNTETRIYDNSSRNVNIFSASYGPLIVLGSYGQLYSIHSYEICYDSDTGMFLELKTEIFDYNSTNPNLNNTIQQFVTLQNTNVWVIPELPSALIVSLLMITLLIGTIAFKLFKTQKWDGKNRVF
jgi:hypothetical protein